MDRALSEAAPGYGVSRSRQVAAPRPWPVTGATLVLFAGAILLPQGVGFRSAAGLPNVDLPRLCMLGAILLLLLRAGSSGSFPIRGAQRTMGLLAALAVWQVVAAVWSESPRASVIWAVGNLLTMWLYALAIISLAAGERHRERVVRMLTTVAVILAAWSVIELVTQHKLVPVRNLWSGAEGVRFSTSLRRLIPGSTIVLPLMSIGPFAVNLTLAGALCALGGFLLVAAGKTRRIHRVHVALFILGVLATQSRVGVLAMAAMLLANSRWVGSRRERRRALFITIAVAFVAVLMGGEGLRLAMSAALEGARAGAESGGSLGTRLANLRLVAEQFRNWWLVGFGPGSLFDADRVVTSVRLMGDLGSYFAFFLESGLPTGVMMTLLMLASVRDGLRSRVAETRAAAVGLIGFWITALSSITPWGWGMALALAGFVESWARAERKRLAKSHG